MLFFVWVYCIVSFLVFVAFGFPSCFDLLHLMFCLCLLFVCWCLFWLLWCFGGCWLVWFGYLYFYLLVVCLVFRVWDLLTLLFSCVLIVGMLPVLINLWFVFSGFRFDLLVAARIWLFGFCVLGLRFGFILFLLCWLFIVILLLNGLL